MSEPQTLISAVRKAVASTDMNQPLAMATTMDEVIATAIAPRRFKMLLLGLFALLAAVLATVGIYGVITYSCNQRTHEFGVRMALGAERCEILKLVVQQGLWLTLMGVGIGLTGAYLLTRFMATLLYGVKPTDPLTYTAVTLLLVGIAVLASYIPARRATRLDAAAVLRGE